MHQRAVDDDCEYVPVHGLPPTLALVPRHLITLNKRSTRCRRRAIAPPRGLRRLGIRTGACPAAAANPSALAPRR